MQKQSSNKEQQADQLNKNKSNPSQQLGMEEPAIEDDGTPVLDDLDLEENQISQEEAENIEWEPEQNPNSNQQAVDKTPGEERGKTEQVTNSDLKGKQVDADPSSGIGKPLRLKPYRRKKEDDQLF